MEHLSAAKLTLSLDGDDAPDPSPGHVSSLGPYLQGALMEQIDGDYAAYLHRQSFNPYSQRCVKEGPRTLVWRVATLNDEAYQHILVPLSAIDDVTLKALGWHLRITAREERTVELKAITNQIALGGPDKVRLRFETPAAFKSAGEYVFMPSVRLLFQNLLMHYTYTYEGNAEVDEETLEYIGSHVRISSYNLHSQYFDHAMGKGRKVPAFAGNLTLSMRGPQQLKGLCRMLLAFGGYAGIGIKTSMGMGGIECQM